MEFFIHPERFWHLIWIVPAILAFAAWSYRCRRNALKQILGTAHFSEKNKDVPVGVNIAPAKRKMRFILLLTSALLLTAAWARPTWGEKIVPFTGAGRDIVVALDLSKSMLCEDIRPNRLEHAKRFVDDLSARLSGDRFGLVAFAGRAFDVCPLTFDRVSFRTILNDQQIGSVPVGGTNLEAALKTAAGSFENSENLGHCVIVLISDGGELTGSLAREAEKLRASKIPVVVVGVGDPTAAAPIPVLRKDGRREYLKDRDGNTVNTRLEETPLAELAAKTGGIYIRSTATEMGDALAANRIKQLTPGAQKENVHAVPIERREWFLIPALIVFSLYLFLGEARSRTRGLRASAFSLLLRSPKMLMFVLLILSVAGTNSSRAEKPGNTEETAENPENTVPESAETLYNRGLQAQEQGDIARSRELYQTALSRPQLSRELRSAATQNLGVGFHTEGRSGTTETAATAQTNLDEALKNATSAEGKFKQARTFYRDFLRANEGADATGTTRNLQILLNEMKQLEELKKQIEELKKQMQQAAQNAQDAAQKQKESNEEKQQNGQNSEAQKQHQNAADQARENAQQQAEQMQQAAEKLNNESLKNAAQQASRELQKAREEQERGEGEKAEEHLKKAAEILQSEAEKNKGENQDGGKQSPNKQSDGEKEEKSQDENNKNDGDPNDSGEQDDLSREPEEQEGTQVETSESNRELDQSATEAILRDMEKEESERRKAIRMHRNSRTREVEKDW